MLEEDEQYKQIKRLIVETMQTVREVGEMAKVSQKMAQDALSAAEKASAAAAEASAAARDASDTAKDARKVAREASKIVGDIGNKFGRFTEGLAWNSMQRIMRKRFGCQYVTPHFKIYDSKGEIKLELDGYGYANGTTNTVCFVEIKSRLRSRDVEQMLNIIDNFSTYFPDHKNKTLHGILSYVEGFDDGAKQLAERSGIYLASIHEKIFKIEHQGKGFLIA
jgi:hypothetical protein